MQEGETVKSVRHLTVASALVTFALSLSPGAEAQNAPQASGATLFQNVRIFDGKGSSLSPPSHVLVKGNVIERISTTAISAEPGTTVIAGEGRTLMPGLIDAHWHAMLIRPTPAQSINDDVGYSNLVAGD
jgi:imidazolonepropionase-like amidohydrolase